MNRAFETVEGMAFPSYNHLESFVVVVPAGFTFSHIDFLYVVFAGERCYEETPAVIIGI